MFVNSLLPVCKRVTLPAEVTTTYLEMHAPPTRAPRSTPEGAAVVYCQQPTAGYYRFLYAGVGGTWLWKDRQKVDDARLLELIRAPGVEVHVLMHRGNPAGYAELNFSRPNQCKLEYFGLFPEFIGRGLGGWFLDHVVRLQWRAGVERIWVHTCSLDHPNALGTYLKAGYSIYNRVTAPNPYR